MKRWKWFGWILVLATGCVSSPPAMENCTPPQFDAEACQTIGDVTYCSDPADPAVSWATEQPGCCGTWCLPGVVVPHGGTVTKFDTRTQTVLCTRTTAGAPKCGAQ